MNMEACQWCRLDKEETLLENESFYVIRDAYPVNKGHLLIISNRHVQDLFGLDDKEFRDLHDILHRGKDLLERDFQPDGYNVGANCGESAGQTIFHFHLHVIPRYRGDVPIPRGGIRNIKVPIVPY